MTSKYIGRSQAVVANQAYSKDEVYTKTESDANYLPIDTVTLPDAIDVDPSAPNDALLIDSNGYVGVNKSSPSSALHVGGVAGSNLRVVTTGADSVSLQNWDDDSGYQVMRLQGSHVYLRTAVSGSGSSQIAVHCDPDGNVLMPRLPSFRASKGNSNVSAGNNYICDVVHHNIGGHYSTSTGRFTAPVSGVYHFEFGSLYFANTSQNELFLFLNGVDLMRTRDDTQNGRYQSQHSSITVEMAAGDFVSLYVDAGEIYGTASNWTNFSGHLVG